MKFRKMVYDLIIIGAGPAGVAAAIYAARQKLNLLVLAKDVGGQVAKKAVDIENYPGFVKISGPELVELYKKQMKANGLEITTEEVAGIEKKSFGFAQDKFLVSTKSDKTYESLAVIFALGAKSRTINVPGEEEFAGKGVSYCSLCDGPIFKGKIVVVIGGGNNGFESALFLSNYVKRVYILEYSDKAKADQTNQELVSKNKNIEIITSARILEIKGKVFVDSVVYKDLTSGEEKTLETSGVFVEIGYEPPTAFIQNLAELNKNGEVIVNPKTLETKTEGFFSAGDCNEGKYKQIVIAAGQGAIAALSAYEYIKKRNVSVYITAGLDTVS